VTQSFGATIQDRICAKSLGMCTSTPILTVTDEGNENTIEQVEVETDAANISNDHKISNKRHGDKSIASKTTAGSHTVVIHGDSTTQSQEILALQKSCQDAGDNVIVVFSDIEYEGGFKDKYLGKTYVKEGGIQPQSVKEDANKEYVDGDDINEEVDESCEVHGTNANIDEVGITTATEIPVASRPVAIPEAERKEHLAQRNAAFGL